MIKVNFKCDKCGNNHGKVIVDRNFDIYVKCEYCDHQEETPVRTDKLDNLVVKLEKANEVFNTILQITDEENDTVGKVHTNLQWIRNITIEAIKDIR